MNLKQLTDMKVTSLSELSENFLIENHDSFTLGETDKKRLKES